MRHRGWHLFSLVDMMLWFRHVPLLDAANLGEWRESQSSAEGWGMHELGKFIDGLMAEMGMDRAELGRRSGLSRQHIHNLLTKETLGRMPDDATIAGLAKAFPAVGEGPFLTKAAMAIGVPVDRLTVVEPDFSKLTNEQLMGILRARLEQGGQHEARHAEAEKRLSDAIMGALLALRSGDVPDPAGLRKEIKAARHERMKVGEVREYVYEMTQMLIAALSRVEEEQQSSAARGADVAEISWAESPHKIQFDASEPEDPAMGVEGIDYDVIDDGENAYRVPVRSQSDELVGESVADTSGFTPEQREIYERLTASDAESMDPVWRAYEATRQRQEHE